MIIETIQYYLERNVNTVYLVLLDASKAFHRVSYDILFNGILIVCQVRRQVSLGSRCGGS